MKRLIALALMIAPTQALAVSWKNVSSGEDGTAAWIDTDSLTRGKDYNGVWYRLRMSDGTYAIILAAVKCPSKLYMDLKMTYYETPNSPMSLDDNLKGKWDAAIPGTYMDSVLDAVCAEAW